MDYRWDSLPGGRSALRLITRDALTIVPIIGLNVQKPDFRIATGIADANFLGRNIRLEIRGQFSSDEPSRGEVSLVIPRQLLWKNMSLGITVHREQLDSVICDQAFINVVNPFHQDYRYTFSPDLETGYTRLNRRNIFALNSPDSPISDFDNRFWFVRITESVGTVTHRRHQLEGYTIAGMIGAGIGLNAGTKNYFEASLRAEYHKLLTKNLQLSLRWEGHLDTGEYPYLWIRYGPTQLRGIEYGDLSGRLMQLAYAGLHYTWVNRDYLAVEQSAFVQYGSAMKSFSDPTTAKNRFAVGTGFRFTMPMYPAGSVLVSFSYNPYGNKWFYIEL